MYSSKVGKKIGNFVRSLNYDDDDEVENVNTTQQEGDRAAIAVAYL
jgi:galactitol-specific phosphotransferase system IIB component